MSGILGRYLLAGAVLLASPAVVVAQTSGGAAGASTSGAGTSGAGASSLSSSPAPAMTSPGPADPSTVIQPSPSSSIGQEVPIHGMSDMSTPSVSNNFDQAATRSSGTACGNGESGSTGASSGSAANTDCGISLGTGDLHSLSIMNSGSASAIDVSKP